MEQIEIPHSKSSGCLLKATVAAAAVAAVVEAATQQVLAAKAPISLRLAGFLEVLVATSSKRAPKTEEVVKQQRYWLCLDSNQHSPQRYELHQQQQLQLLPLLELEVAPSVRLHSSSASFDGYACQLRTKDSVVFPFLNDCLLNQVVDCRQ
jgi:hypothetical protein